MFFSTRRSASIFLSCLAALFFAAFSLLGCGGGSNSPSSQAPSPTPTPSASQPAPGASGSAAGTGGSSSGAGSGTSGSGSGTASGSGSATAALAYVAGSSNTFYGIRVDSASNVSTVSGSPYSVAGTPNSFATTGNLLFVASVSSDLSSAAITSFRADANGVLTQLTSTPVKSEGGVMITVDSSGKFLYATATVPPGGPGTNSGAIFGFSIDQTSGALALLPNTPWYLQGGMGPPTKPRVSANGSWLCVDMELARTNEGAQCYARHADGSIDGGTYVQPAVSNTSICGLAVTADSTHVIYTDCAQSVFSSLISNTQNGNAVPSGGSGSGAVDIDPSGHWLALTNSSGNLAIFSIGTGDSLAAKGAPMSTPSHTNQVAFSRSGTYVFVTSGQGTVVFSFNPTSGALTPLNSSSPAPGVDGSLATM